MGVTESGPESAEVLALRRELAYLRGVERAARLLVPHLYRWAPNSIAADRLRQALGYPDVSWAPMGGPEAPYECSGPPPREEAVAPEKAAGQYAAGSGR